MVRLKKSTNQKPISTGSKEQSGFKKRKKANELAVAADILRKQAAQFFQPKTPKPPVSSLGLEVVITNTHVSPSLAEQTGSESHPIPSKCSSSGSSKLCGTSETDDDQNGRQTSKDISNFTSGTHAVEDKNGNNIPTNWLDTKTTSSAISSIPDDCGSSNSKHCSAEDGNNQDCEIYQSDTDVGDDSTEINHALSQNDKDFSGFDAQDPSTWESPLSVHEIKKIFSKRNVNPNKYSSHKFPLVNGHRFKATHFLGTKPNGEIFQREWMRYSFTSNSLFCISCCVYGSNNQSTSKWMNFGKGNTGYQDFKHYKERIKKHEESQTHVECIRRMKLFQSNSENEKSILKSTMESQNTNIMQWRLILRGILDAILYLAKNDLALQGHSHHIQNTDCGNFLNLVKLLAKYYPPLKQHLDNKKKGSVSYLSPNIQNEFIEICGISVRQAIINKVKERKYFSMSFDSTPDVSHQDQFSQVIRSVHCSSSGCYIEENFIDFIKTTEKTGLGLSEVILRKFEYDGLELKNCKGQSYDNGANMAGIYSGVQKRILDKNPGAKFVPCVAHSLNLVGVNAAEKVLEAKLILGKVQTLYVFFSCSTVKWKCLTSKLHKTLKCQSTTRWSAAHDAVSALWSQYGDLMELLEEMSNSDNLSSEIYTDAESKLRDLHSFKFLFGLTIWNHILFQINLCNIYFQGKQVDIEQCKLRLFVLKQWLDEFRETGFSTSYTEAKIMAEALGIETTSGYEDVRRGRGRNRRYMDTEEYQLAKTQTNMERFKVEFFDKLNTIIVIGIRETFSSNSRVFGKIWFSLGRQIGKYGRNCFGGSM